MNKNLFGTDGIRNRMGNSPFTLHELPRLAYAYASWLINTYQQPLTIALADDTRASASCIKHTFIAALHAYGISTCDAGPLTTPALLKLVQTSSHIHGGIMISASHNPHTDNGIKLITDQGKKISAFDAHAISQLFCAAEIQSPSYEQFGIHQTWDSAALDYSSLIYNLFAPNFLSGLTIALDCANGAASHLAPQIFTQLGAHVIPLHSTPTGTNINDRCGSLHPAHLQQAVITHKADIGFAFDGDGDRVIAVSQHGALKTGDDLLALLTTHPAYAAQSAVVGTLMTNQGLHQHLQTQHKQLLRTPVGDTHVLAALEQGQLLLGGEPSGHIITRDYAEAADGIFTALRVIETVIHTHNWSLNTFTHFPQTLINIPVVHKRDLRDPHMETIIKTHESLLKQGRLIVRYSGTEPLLRIMVEELELADAQRISQQLADALFQELN